MDISQRPHKPRVPRRDPIPPLAPYSRYNSIVEALEPSLDIAFHKHHFRFRVHAHEILPECERGHIRHCTVAAEQLIPFVPCEGGAFAGVFGVEGLVPHAAVKDVREEREGVAAGDGEDVEGALHRCFFVCLLEGFLGGMVGEEGGK